MKKTKRVFLIVADSMGIGAAPDADCFYNGDGNDTGSDTYRSVSAYKGFSAPFINKLGIGNIDGVNYTVTDSPIGAYGKFTEVSPGKDTVTGHWELSGVITDKAMPTFPNGFPVELLSELEKKWGRGWICNRTYSGTEVIHDYGREHIETGKLIVYTSADSVMQIAAHEDIVSVNDLYRCCEIAREMLVGRFAVGRVIARPFTGEYPSFERTPDRHDYSLLPPSDTLCDIVSSSGMDVIGVGKIGDIFAHRGITREIHISGNTDGINKTLELLQEDFRGLCFVNLVDFDMKYGHRRDVRGYAEAVMELDCALEKMCAEMNKDDCLMLTADHGCDPGFYGTDHTREFVPVLVYGSGVNPVNIGIRSSFADLGKTVAELLSVDGTKLAGESFAHLL